MGQRERTTVFPDRVEVESYDVPEELEIFDRREQRLADALTPIEEMANSSGTLTAAQLSKFCRATAKVLMILLRERFGSQNEDGE